MQHFIHLWVKCGPHVGKASCVAHMWPKKLVLILLKFCHILAIFKFCHKLAICGKAKVKHQLVFATCGESVAYCLSHIWPTCGIFSREVYTIPTVPSIQKRFYFQVHCLETEMDQIKEIYSFQKHLYQKNIYTSERNSVALCSETNNVKSRHA